MDRRSISYTDECGVVLHAAWSVCLCVKVVVTRNGELKATFIMTSQTWRLVTSRRSIIMDEWQYVELSWHQDKGVYLHIAKRRITPASSTTTVQSHPHPNVSHDALGTRTVYIGSSTDTSAASPARHFQVLVDELSVWFADRDHVKAFGFLEDGTTH